MEISLDVVNGIYQNIVDTLACIIDTPGFKESEPLQSHPSGIYSQHLELPLLYGDYAILEEKQNKIILTFYIVTPFVFYRGNILYKWDVDFKLRSMCYISNYGLNNMKDVLVKQLKFKNTFTSLSLEFADIALEPTDKIPFYTPEWKEMGLKVEYTFSSY